MTIIVLKNLKSIGGGVPCRVNLWIMLFTCCWVAYMLRANMSLNIVAMVPKQPVPPNGNVTEGTMKEDGNDTIAGGNEMLNVSYDKRVEAEPIVQTDKTFTWTANEQALILGSYYWSYIFTSLVGGIVAEKWSPTKLVFWSTVVAAISTCLCPLASEHSFVCLIILRFVIGASGGFIYPACHVLIARWVPPHEKGKFIAAMMGGVLGTVMTWSVSAPLIQMIGWPLAGFYLQGLAALIWAFLWYYLIADSPVEHNRISEHEKQYILDALKATVSNKKGFPPLRDIFTSIPFFAMVTLHYGNIWGLFFVMNAGPRYVSSVLNFNLSSAGFISALPYLARLIMAFMFGSIGDVITKRELMKTPTIRKAFCLFSHIIPGIFLILLVAVSTSTAMSVALITISMGFNGAATLTNLQNHQDLSPNYAGTLYGIANAIGSTSGFITPVITAYFTKTGDTVENWGPVFYVGASVYIATALIFIILGKAAIQPWNSKEEAK